MTLLLSATLKVSLLVLVALATATLFRRRSAAMRHWILAVAFVAGLTVPALELLLPEWPVPLPSAWSSSAAGSSLRLISDADMARRGPRGIPGPDSSAPSSEDAAGVSVGRALLAVWMIGLVAGLGVLAAGMLRIRHWSSRATPVGSGPWRAIADELRGACGLRRHVRLLHSAHPTMLVTWGTRTPSILLPAGALDWPDDRIRVVLHHELGHIRRGDWIVTLAATVSRCIYWFNPLIWIACRRLRHESEHACDDLVLASGVSGADYAAHLLAVARESKAQRHAWSPAIAIAHQSTLEGRVRAMLSTRVNRAPLSGPVRAATLVVVVASTLPIAVASLSGDAGAPPASADVALAASDVRPVTDLVGRGRETPPTRVAVTPAGPAQVAPGTIDGVLYDQFGGLLPGVLVALTHIATGGRYDASSDPGGAFAFRALPPGEYELTTSLPGFTTVTNVVRVAAGESVRRQITLPLGTVTETISVTCEGASLSAAPRRTGYPEARQRALVPTVPNLFSGGIGGQIKAPTKTVHASPVCPAGVPRSPAVVALAGRIGIDGFLSDLRDTSAQPQPALVASAMEAVRQWEFTPTLLNGVPVEANITITVQYSWPN